jgi:DNA invertase Pin-like site-specific DNA recombinase
MERGLSGSKASSRPALQEALAALRRGDALVVYSMSRLAWSTRGTLAITDQLKKLRCDLVSLNEKIDTTSAMGCFAFKMVAILAELERNTVSDRTSAALRHMRAQGRFTGGCPPYGYRLLEPGEPEAIPGEQVVLGRARELHAAG